MILEIKLGKEEKERLEIRHKTERDKRVADRLKCVLLLDERWSQVQIAQALRIRPETVHDHIVDYKSSQKLKPENGGSQSQMNEAQTSDLIKHLELNTYTKVADICAHIQKAYNVKYTISGMTQWLHAHRFSYKQPKSIPAKADTVKQAEFIVHYEQLMKTTPENEPILFSDAVHPTMATKISGGWIRTGQDKPIGTTASRTRMNLIGALNLTTMQITVESYKTVDSQAMGKYFALVRESYPDAPKIHMIVDQGPYNKAAQTKMMAIKYGVVLHYLPPYSPNLNPIERVWKVMNEYARNNVFFASAKAFRKAVTNFYSRTWPRICMSLVDRINDNFQQFNQASSG
jgi:transposase